MSRLSRGQIVALVTIALIFAITALIFDKITTYKEEETKYLIYDKQKQDILLNGSYLEYVNLDEEYIEKGLKTKKEYITTYFLNSNEVAQIDTSNLDTYQVRYYLPNNEIITKVVIIVDTKSPSISVPDKQTITSAEVETFDLEKDVIVTDNSGEVKLKINNTLSKTPGIL